ncbi:MAG: hypothetical protein QNJ22_21565 [Desulfosarcinaceae bacterium]|nr:hypothetical protein [Desulfosarcinaceae bacterium]
MKNLNSLNCGLEKPLNIIVGALLFLVGVGFAIVSVTVLPVVGLVVAIPVIGLAIFFVAAPRSKECQVNFS